jgi:hypothetical protein
MLSCTVRLSTQRVHGADETHQQHEARQCHHRRTQSSTAQRSPAEMASEHQIQSLKKIEMNATRAEINEQEFCDLLLQTASVRHTRMRDPKIDTTTFGTESRMRLMISIVGNQPPQQSASLSDSSARDATAKRRIATEGNYLRNEMLTVGSLYEFKISILHSGSVTASDL